MKYIFTILALNIHFLCLGQSEKIYKYVKLEVLWKCIIADSSITRKDNDSKYVGLKVILSKDTSQIKAISDKRMGEFYLDYNSIYIITISKAGYGNKKIQINTTDISVSRWNDGFEPFRFACEIFKQHKDIVTYKQPELVIFYDTKIDEFNVKLLEKKDE